MDRRDGARGGKVLLRGLITLTAAPQTAPVSFSTVEEAIRAVRGRGMRLSTARRLVLEALFAAQGPVSAQELSRALAIDATSVYRNLELLERHGLVRHVHLGHGPGLYVLVGRRELEYLHCERCAKITSVAVEDLDPVRQQIRERFGYHARFTHFAIVGLCEECAARPEESNRHNCDRGAGMQTPTGATSTREPHHETDPEVDPRKANPHDSDKRT
jgi:Fur family transcriptional regulator, ferric uptake regulator